MNVKVKVAQSCLTLCDPMVQPARLLGDTVLELTHRSDGSMKGFHFCLETDHFDSAVAELQKKGVEIAQEPHPTAARETREKGWRRVVFWGPDRERIEIRG